MYSKSSLALYAYQLSLGGLIGMALPYTKPGLSIPAFVRGFMIFYNYCKL